ncbi:hypothetical protein QZH41_006214 [Actinostola sp. cb2023]|nr:hypothetical protein QZH41_006214 [Actinostola sp. cb2023]
MFEIDFAEHKGASTYGLSKEDQRFLEIAEQGIHQCEDGHYELPLPLKDKRVKLPNNREAALRRLNQLKRKLLAAKYREDYIPFMNKVIESGYAERVPTSKEAESKVTEIVTETKDNVWYIPHHGVYHPKKPNKIRVVFDCAAEYQNESLNKHLLQGPDLTNNLTGVLYRFRQESFAFTCDIEAMFHQVKVIQEHRDLLRFLWWENGDTTKEPQEYRMTVHLFGATSPPGCANFALKSTAKDHEDEYGGAAADFLHNDFYVDDGLKSVPSVEEAIKLIKDIKGMCAKGGFNLHKFVSNSKEYTVSIPSVYRLSIVIVIESTTCLLKAKRNHVQVNIVLKFWCSILVFVAAKNTIPCEYRTSILRKITAAESLSLSMKAQQKGGLSTKKRSTIPKMFANGVTGRCPVALFKEYIAKRPGEFHTSGPFYLAIIENPQTDVWYKKQRMVQNRINKIMQTIIADTDLKESGKRLTNHSARKTLVKKLKSNQVPRSAIVKLTGHRSEKSLDDYEEGDERELQELSNYISHPFTDEIAEENGRETRPPLLSVQPLNDNPVVIHRPASEVASGTSTQQNFLSQSFQDTGIKGSTFNNCNVTFNVGQK